MARRTSQLQGKAGGVPYLAVPPRDPAPAPVVLAWHLMDPPRTETAFAAALPLGRIGAVVLPAGLSVAAAHRRLGEQVDPDLAGQVTILLAQALATAPTAEPAPLAT